MEKNTAKLSVLPAAAVLLSACSASPPSLPVRALLALFFPFLPAFNLQRDNWQNIPFLLYEFLRDLHVCDYFWPHVLCSASSRTWASCVRAVVLGHCQLCPGLMVISLPTKGNSELQCLTRESSREPTTA